MKQLHPGAKWQFRVGFLVFVLFLSFFFSFQVIPFGVSAFLLTFIVVFALLALIVEIYVRLAYKNWKYELTGNNLKIEKGIIWKDYKSIPYERVQNVDIHRGILARLLNFSTMDIQTAGYSGVYHGRRMMSEGHIPAVSRHDAEKMRDFLMAKISRKSGGGV